MSARVLAVTTLLLDVIDDLNCQDQVSDAEMLLLGLLCNNVKGLELVKAEALAEMQALAPRVLAEDAAWSGGAA